MCNIGGGAVKRSLAAMVAELANGKEVAGCKGSEEMHFLSRCR